MCTHGALARSCEICERDEEIAALRAEVDRLTAEYRTVRTVAVWTVDRMRRLADIFGEPGLRIQLDRELSAHIAATAGTAADLDDDLEAASIDHLLASDPDR